jgi:hypothetical protein
VQKNIRSLLNIMASGFPLLMMRDSRENKIKANRNKI